MVKYNTSKKADAKQLSLFFKKILVPTEHIHVL